MGDSGKTVGVIEEMRPELTSTDRNLQENLFSSFENGQKWVEI